MKIISKERCIIGEGPVWNSFNNKLYQVNGFGANEILEIDIISQNVTIRKLDFSVAAIAFTKKGEILVWCRNGAFILESDNSLKPIYDIKKYEIKYGNDAKVGPDGRFYIGTQSSKRIGASYSVDGKLYSVDKCGKVKILLDNLLLSNGFDWSMDEKRFYHTDSDTNVIKEYDFDKLNGEIFFTGRQIEVKGVDGFTIDKNDFLYVACWGQGHIAVVDTKDMQIKRYIEVPAKIPASCAFVGENMDKLIVVTASLYADANDVNAGCTFICDMENNGRKPYLFG